MDSCEVLIVGAGPVGLLLASELGMRGIRTLVVEEREGQLRHPKANTHNARSMEIYRRHGIGDRLRATGLPLDRPTDVGYFSRLLGHELHRVPLPSAAEALRETKAGETRWPTPEPQLRTTQMALEPLLLERAESFPSVTVRFGCQVVSLEAGGEHQVVGLSSGADPASHIAARFVVGCDGGRSWVRRHLDIPFVGAEGLEMEFLGGRMQATYFRAPGLLARFPHKPTWMHWMMHPEGRSILVLIDPARDEFLMHYQLPPDGSPVDFGQRLAAALGESIAFEVISTAVWRAGIGVVAQRYRQGGVFLAGDAAHLFTPTGGFGLNTGIEDAFNLGWKLALACRGTAGPMLLDSYEAERKPIAERNTAYALHLAKNNGSCPTGPALDADGEAGEKARVLTSDHLRQFARWEFDTPGIQLGGRYRSEVIDAEQGAEVEDRPTEYVPNASPGGRLPHVWIADDRSIFDRLGPDFTLVSIGRTNAGDRWREAAHALGIDLTLLELEDRPEWRSLYGAALLVVRPDQYVAWRGAEAAAPEGILRRCVGGA